jgi:integrase
VREPTKVKLTYERIRQITPPDKGELTVWDTEAPGLGVRCLPSGMKTYIIAYRVGYGRSGISRRLTIGKIERTELATARELALKARHTVLTGGDPIAKRREAIAVAAFESLKISDALSRYSSDLTLRKVVDRKSVVSILQRQLIGHVGDIPLGKLDRRAIVEAVEVLETKGQLGSAKALRSYTSTFLTWCTDRGMMENNPLLGYRAPRATRSQRIASVGRELPDNEIALVWHACFGPVNRAYGLLIRTLILTGQRKTETARMRWSDVDLDQSVWRIPEEETKNGFPHEVPLSGLALEVLKAAPKHSDCDWVFSTNGKSPISGWSKLGAKLRDTINSGVVEPMPHWTVHDLRRTFRSGLTRLGIEPDVAEIMLNHRPATLRSIYDRDPREDARRDAADRWANHVGAIIDPDGQSNIVKIGGAT